MLHDDSLSDHQACMISDIGLVQRVGNLAASGSDVGEIRYHDKVEVGIEVARVGVATNGVKASRMTR